MDTQDHCPVEATLELIGGKYKALILWHLSEKTLRFSQLHKCIPNITPKMLTQQLRELETDCLIHREVYPVIPHPHWRKPDAHSGGHAGLGCRISAAKGRVPLLLYDG